MSHIIIPTLLDMTEPGHRVWQRSEVAERIVAGETLVIFRDQVLKIPSSWLNTHPGGALAILHYVGRDATGEIEAYHAAPALKMIERYVVGTVETVPEEGWAPLMPPVSFGWVRRQDSEGVERWSRKADVERTPIPKTSENSLLSFTPQNHAPSEILLVEKSDKTRSDAAGAFIICPKPSGDLPLPGNANKTCTGVPRSAPKDYRCRPVQNSIPSWIWS